MSHRRQEGGHCVGGGHVRHIRWQQSWVHHLYRRFFNSRTVVSFPSDPAVKLKLLLCTEHLKSCILQASHIIECMYYIILYCCLNIQSRSSEYIRQQHWNLLALVWSLAPQVSSKLLFCIASWFFVVVVSLSYTVFSALLPSPRSIFPCDLHAPSLLRRSCHFLFSM